MNCNPDFLFAPTSKLGHGCKTVWSAPSHPDELEVPVVGKFLNTEVEWVSQGFA